MAKNNIDPTIVTAAIAEAEASDVPVAKVSLDAVARRAGISRATLFRKIGGRQALEQAVLAAGTDPGRRTLPVRERALAAAHDLIVQDGVGALTLEAVARRIDCATTSIHTQFAGRAGLLSAVFERYVPLPRVVKQLKSKTWPPASLEAGVRTVYTIVYDTLQEDAGLLAALLAESLARPDGEVMQLARSELVPLMQATIGHWLQTEAKRGRCLALPASLLLPMLIAPIATHMLIRHQGNDDARWPARKTVIDSYVAAFCTALRPNGVEP